MAVLKCPCSTFSNVMFKQMPRSHWFVSINSQYLQLYWLLQQTSEHTKLQRYKATKIHTLTPLTYELFFQNSSIIYPLSSPNYFNVFCPCNFKILYLWCYLQFNIKLYLIGKEKEYPFDKKIIRSQETHNIPPQKNLKSIFCIKLF